jgi:hypothetical protein
LSTNPSGRWYGVIDTAQDPALLPLVKQCAEHVSIISGQLDPQLAAALPWVIALDPREPLVARWHSEGEGRNWGILVQSPMTLGHVKLLFKKFINAQLPDGRVVLFRFYDPRVFRTFIRAAQPAERAPWFRGITHYSVESERPGHYHDFTLRDGALFDGARPVEGPSV